METEQECAERASFLGRGSDVSRAVKARQSSALQRLRENSPLCRPFGTRFAEILPGTPVPGYRLSRPFGTDSVG